MEKSWLINFVKFTYFITQISLSFRGFFFPYFCNKYSNESCLQTFYDIEREKDCAITNLIHANILIWAKLNEIIQQAQISFSGNNWYSTFIVLFLFFSLLFGIYFGRKYHFWCDVCSSIVRFGARVRKRAHAPAP